MLNKLSPDAYSMANLTLNQIVFGLGMKVNEPMKLWKALNSD